MKPNTLLVLCYVGCSETSVSLCSRVNSVKQSSPLDNPDGLDEHRCGGDEPRMIVKFEDITPHMKM